MTDLFVDPYSESYPPSLWGGVRNPLDLTGNYPGIEALSDFGALEASGLYGNAGTSKPTATFTTGQFVELADGSRAHWDGTKWVVGPVAGSPAPSAPPVVIPDATWTKAEIVAWLVGEGVTLTDEAQANLDVAELLVLVDAVLDPDLDPEAVLAEMIATPPEEPVA